MPLSSFEPRNLSLPAQARIGILGGFGPLAGAVFHQRLLEAWASNGATKKDQDYPAILHVSHAVTGFDSTGVTDSHAIVESLASTFDIFRQFKADFVAIVCNSLVEIVPLLERRYGMDLLTPWNAAPAVKRASDTVVISSMSLRRYLGSKLPQLRWPTLTEQHLIQRSIEGVMTGRVDPTPLQALINDYLAREVEVRIACTELSCLGLKPHWWMLDTLDCLVSASVGRGRSLLNRYPLLAQQG